MAHEVFISYSNKDKQMANAVCHYLEHEKIRCWIAPRDVRPGANFAGEIVDAIPKSKVMLLILSASSNSSKQVLREMEIAVKNDLIVIPLRIEDFLPTGSMSYYLSTTQWIDIIDKKIDSRLNVLTDRIAGIIGIMTPADEVNKTEGKVADRYIIKEAGEKSTSSTKKKKLGRKALALIIVATVVLAAAIAATLVLVLRPQGTSDDMVALNPNMKVEIVDGNLKAGILATLDNMGETVDGELTVADMMKLEKLMIASTAETDGLGERVLDEEELSRIKAMLITNDDDISSLDGLQYATNLNELMVVGKSIRDLSPIANLKKLEHLDLVNNKISELGAVNDLTNLKTLVLSNNLIIDLSPLENLTGLTDLGLNENLISDIEPLKKLVNMNGIVLMDNNITDISALSEMRYLSGIGLDSNNIDDISVLANLRKAKWLLLRNNNISDISALAGLDELQWLHITNNNISDISALEDSTALQGVWADGNPINNLETLAEGETVLSNLSVDQDTYDNTPSKVITALQSRGTDIQIEGASVPQVSPGESDDSNAVGEIQSSVLRDAVIYTLGKMAHPVLGDITAEDLLTLDRLLIKRYSTDNIADFNQFTTYSADFYMFNSEFEFQNLDGLEYAKNLESVFITRHNLKDIEALGQLTNLKHLFIIANPIESLDPLLGSAQSIVALSLRECESIQDFSVLNSMINLEYLDLSYTNFQVLGSLSNINNIKTLKLNGLDIVDFIYLESGMIMDTVEELHIESRIVGDITFLVGFKSLQRLYISKETYEGNIDAVNELIANGCSVYAGGQQVE